MNLDGKAGAFVPRLSLSVVNDGRAMVAKDVTFAYRDLLERASVLDEAACFSVRSACEGDESLCHAVLRLLESDESGGMPFHLLAFPVLGALTGDPDPALRICVLSRVWWAGAEALDDVMDGEFDTSATGLTTAAATIAGTACLTLIPQDIVNRAELPSSLETVWTRELTRTGLRSAGSQLDDARSTEGDCTWKRSMVTYVGKSGSPYARDCVMAAALGGANTEQLRRWRAFGHLFGALRQLTNDRAPQSPDQDIDIANGTRTLLLAHAVEALPRDESRLLVEEYDRASSDRGAREAVWRRFRQPDLAIPYNKRISVIKNQASTLLEDLAEPSDHRDLIQWMVNVSADGAKLQTSGGAL
ncbi:hypothetical protein [Actinacidiphila sp. bgisy167]|uniref:hypothetical protein n=1 Tax=Actinacidiphila sp. bgisy167 TaxID=3413797 RepID=UPI003D73355E